MNFHEYQAKAAQTANMAVDGLLMGALGVAGEAGEVADLVKKHRFHGHPLDRVKLTKELGDVLWYVAYIATVSDIELDEVAITNIAKLQVRYGDAFSVEKSRNRKEGDD